MSCSWIHHHHHLVVVDSAQKLHILGVGEANDGIQLEILLLVPLRRKSRYPRQISYRVGE